MARTNSILVKTEGPKVAEYGILSPAVTVINDDAQWFTTNMMYEDAEAGTFIQNETIAGGPFVKQTVIDNTADKTLWELYYPFSINTSITTTTMGVNPDDIEKAAHNALEVVAQKAIERELWHGDLAKQLTATNNNRYLASSSAVDVTPVAGTGVKVRYGLALLEKALGDAPLGSVGVIHTTRDVASALRLQEDEDGALRTELGNGVVAGVGYSKAGPTGAQAASNLAWMYATGPVTVRLGPVSVVPDKLSQAVDTKINNISYFVDRPAAVTWSTSKLYAVLVDLTQDYA